MNNYTSTEYQYVQFRILMKETVRTGMLNEAAIPSFLSKQYNFVKDLASQLSVSIKDLAKLFMNKSVFNFFSKIKWSFRYVFDLAKKGFGYYKDILEAISEYLSKTKIGKWTEDKLKDLDNWLKTHPKTKKIIGIGVAALLIYIWFNMSFTGDFKYDFNLIDVISALSGKFSLSQLFAGKDGVKLLLLFATGAIGLSFPWPGPTSVKFLTAVVNSVAAWAGVKLKKENTTPYNDRVGSGFILREFNSKTPHDEFVWHRDKQNRIVEVLKSENWQFQMDNQLPVPLNPGDILRIPKEKFHRIIRGDGDLLIKISEY